MKIHAEFLWFCAAVLAIAAAALSVVGLRKPRYRGVGWWVAGLWMADAGIVLVALERGAWVQVVATLLMVQWPLLTLIGMRRFHGRTALPASERSDWLMLLLASLAAASAPVWSADGSLGLVLPATGVVMAHLYAACLLCCWPGDRDGVPLSVLGLTLITTALLPTLIAWPAAESLASPEHRAVAASLGTVTTAFVAVSMIWSRTERYLLESRRRLRVLANIDTLTQVPNRRHFNELATLALRADAAGSASLVMFDIDHFKRINDDHGHAAGDRALQLVADSMRQHLRAQDIAGRQGGDEFVLLLRETSVRDAIGVASRMVALLQSRAAASRMPPLSLSFGAVRIGAAERVDSALRRADQALYEAKRQGRSRIVTAAGDEQDPVFTDSQRLGLTIC